MKSESASLDATKAHRFNISQQRRTSQPSERQQRRSWGMRSDRARYDWPRSRTGQPAIFRTIEAAKERAS